MNEQTADEELRAEVDILMYDYLVCMATYGALRAAPHRPKDQDQLWLEATVRRLRSLLPPVESLPLDIQIKTHILEITQILSEHDSEVQPEPAVYAELASTFISTCNATRNEAISCRAAEVALQLCTGGHMDSLQRMPQEVEQGEKIIPECIARTLPVIGISTHVYHEAIQTVHIRRDKAAAHLRPIMEIMKQLTPPILAQLERGKLNGLSRDETQQLKQRVGL
ncbi:hypothetical protein BJX61DRAFT_395351 [Aspergillus egyptiacus]|nr:hypothetical protein BJX61DRAFT_395351 [Aspergillus egyptiacus]